MKRILLTIPALALLLCLNSCDKLNEQSFGVQLVKDFEINLAEGETSFSQEDILNAIEANSDLDGLEDKIVDYRIKTVSYKVWEYQGPAEATFDGLIRFEDTANAAEFVSVDIVDQVLSSLNDSDERVTLDFTDGEIERLASYLLEGNSVKFKSSGDVSSAPMSMILQVFVDVEVRAEVEE
ncbi:MAG: hypothetical protein HRT74_04470 [Flavobacteriales bacterium]|nr:hypothetical protein [Flavobacteriales bacterium]